MQTTAPMIQMAQLPKSGRQGTAPPTQVKATEAKLKKSSTYYTGTVWVLGQKLRSYTN